MTAKVKCTILRETEKAIQIRQETRNREPIEAWIPRSQCDRIFKMPDGKGGFSATITMANWLAEKHNLWEEA